jgi:hypothetical protein
MRLLSILDQPRERKLRARHLSAVAKRLIHRHKHKHEHQDRLAQGSDTGGCTDGVGVAEGGDGGGGGVGGGRAEYADYAEWLAKVHEHNLHSLVDGELVGTIQVR